MKTVVFEGPLQELYPEGIEVNAQTAADALALLENFPGLTPSDPQFHARLPDFPTRDSMYAVTDAKVIRVVQIEQPDPKQFSGSGQKAMALVQIVIGVIIIVASWGTGTMQGYAMMASGFAMVLGGIMSLMMKQPEKSKNENDPSSQYLPASKNTVKIGTTIPLLFGRRKVYGHLLSFNVTATNLNAPAPSNPGLPTLGKGGFAGVWNTFLNPDGSWGTPNTDMTYGGEWEEYNDE